ncbi:MAG: mechanosensitive ion channel family protein [Bacteroidota bacterium]
MADTTNTFFDRDKVDALLESTVDWIFEVVPELFFSFLLFMLIRFLLNKTIKRFEKKIEERPNEVADDATEDRKRASTMIGVLKTIANSILWTLFIITALKIMGFDLTTVIASAGVLSLAISFGAQELVRDAISGFFLLLEDRIRVGDVVSINGVSGGIENINLRTITLRDFSGATHIFQNGKIDTLSNLTKEWSATVHDISIAYKEDVTRVLGIVKQVGEELAEHVDFKDKLLGPLEIFGVDAFGENAVILKVRMKTLAGEQWTIKREFNKRIKSTFDLENIEIPFPQRTIHLDANRQLQRYPPHHE